MAFLDAIPSGTRLAVDRARDIAFARMLRSSNSIVSIFVPRARSPTLDADQNASESSSTVLAGESSVLVGNGFATASELSARHERGRHKVLLLLRRLAVSCLMYRIKSMN
jgi:hypothetical protein